MKTSLISTTKTIFTLIALFTFSIVAQANINETSINENKATRNITKIIIKDNNTVQILGACSPADCDWGTAPLQYDSPTRIGGRYIASYNQGFAKRNLKFYKHHTGKLYLQAAYTYTDSRPAQKHSEYFVQKACGGFQGIVTDKDNHNLKLAGTTIKFTSEDGSISKETTSSSKGSYKIELPVGRYKVKATSNEYKTYTTGQGFFVVNCQGIQTGNIFMKKKPEPACGYQGIVVDKDNHNLKLAGAKIKFVSEDVSIVRHTTSSSNGSYQITPLPQGRYRVKATLDGYKTYMSQGFFVVNCQGIQSGDIYMEQTPEPACTGEYKGIILNKDNRNLKLTGVKIKFVSEDVSIVRHVTSSSNGSYQITLPEGRYRVKATLNGYNTYMSQGFFVVNCQGKQTGNIFMEKTSNSILRLLNKKQLSN